MKMEQMKKGRAVRRTMFTRSANTLDNLLNAREVDLREVETVWGMLQQRDSSLKEADKQIFEAMLNEDATEDVLTNELIVCEEYMNKFMRLNIDCTQMLRPKEELTARTSMESAQVAPSKLKLPIIEIIKFNGDIRDWLQFWCQFKKIHEDDALVAEDKFQYLLQCTTIGSRARELVESFPPTRENYAKAVDSLKSRFGREDMLIEVYVRELLKIVMNNALPNGTKLSLCTLYDKIETQLRALETLGITTDKCAAMLYPLVESCLPEDLLRAWQRSSSCTSGHDQTLSNRLDRLIQFVKSEVESEERISLAVEGFGIHDGQKPKRNKTKVLETDVPTATGLMSCEAARCIFCNGTHASDVCYKARKMSLDEKRKILTKKHGCFRCLKSGHQSKKCRVRLSCILCGGSHEVLMCSQLPANKFEQKSDPDNKNNDTTRKPGTSNELSNCTDTRVFLQTLRVNMINDGEEREVRAVIDTGSQRSYILKTTAAKLYREKRREKIIHSLFGGVNTNEQEHACYDVRLVNLEGSYACHFEVMDQPVICHEISAIFEGPWIRELEGLGIKLGDTQTNSPIELLIGADVAGKLLTGRRHILNCGLVAVQTLLGWTLMGKIPIAKAGSTTMTVMSLFTNEMSVEQLWQLDVLGITDPTEKKQKEELQLAARELFENTITVNADGRYEVKMPWLECHPALPSNYSIAKKRLEIALKKLDNDGRREEYGKVFEEWKREGIIEEVTKENTVRDVHYLPHRPVYKENSTTKVRPVFDASAKERNKISLNQCLEKGANLIELIPNILWRFRKEPIGVVADIAKAFLQISLHPTDRDFLRFLWTNQKGEEIIFRHRRVVFGVSCSPFLLGATIEHHLKKIKQLCMKEDEDRPSQDTILKLQKSFYVDNCVTSVSTKEELTRFICESQEIMNLGKFNLRGWEFSHDKSENSITPVLGLLWNRSEDTLYVNVTSRDGSMAEIVTKRIILSMTQQVFDPVGFTCPVVLLPKVLLQKLWETKLSWDAQVDKDTETKFVKWVRELRILSDIKVPRWLGMTADTVQKLSIHTFADASKIAYAAVILLRIESGNNVSVQLIQAKARVAPQKKISIPRLELLAATIASRLYTSVREIFNEEIECYFWSDSSTVLTWIKQTEEWSVFVRNRVQEIRTLTTAESWRYVEGTRNPADLPSRGCSASQLLESKWWEGPQWLYEPSHCWPLPETEVDEVEVHHERRKKVIASLITTTNETWYCRYFSKFSKICRMIGWIKRFIHNSKCPTERRTKELSMEEIADSERTLFKIVQQEAFAGDKMSSIESLNPVEGKDGLIRLRTRIANRDDAEDFRFPIVLPGKHAVVKLLIFDTHTKSCHVGIQGLQSILRERYWILGGRRTIRAAINRCVQCKRFNAKRIETTQTPLPIDRVRDAAVFEIVGVDFAGPLFLKGREKAWICLFTCAVYRAVHLELVTSMSTDDFIQAMRRFIARRGRPKIIYSDNGTNFVGTENALKALDWNQIMAYSHAERITWRFNPPSAPWWGGWWERLIGILKGLLRRVLGKASLNYEEMVTVLCDCEAIINARPLTYVSEQPQELIALTPAMYLRDLVEDGVPDCDIVDSSSLNRRLRYRHKLRKDLRSRFRSEYLGMLKQGFSGKKTPRKVALDDVVIIGNDNDKRINWPLARVIELIPGKDGDTRLVRVRTPSGQLLRPVQRIYPLECGPTQLSDKRSWDCSVEETNQDCLEELADQDRDLADHEPEVSESGANTKERKDVVTRSGRVVRVPKRFDL